MVTLLFFAGGFFLPLMVVFLLWRVTFIARERELAFASAVFWGAIGAALLAITVGTSLTQQMLTMMPAGMARGLQVILLAPIYEELGKLLVLPVLLLVLRRQSVRTLSGGIVLGMAIGTGFGVTENMFMLLGIANTQPEEELLATFWIRLLGTTPLHMTATAIPVALLGWSRGRGHDGFLQVLSCAGGLILGIGLHAIWNISVLAGNLAQPETVHAGLCIVMSSAFLLMVVLLMLGTQAERRKFARFLDELVRGHVLLPQEALVIGRRRMLEEETAAAGELRRLVARYLFPPHSDSQAVALAVEEWRRTR